MTDAAAEQRHSVVPETGASQINAAQMTLAGPDGLMSVGEALWARPVHPHSLVKAERVNNYAQTAITAVGKRFEVWWLELFAGPGLLWDRAKGEVVDGSPLRALKMTGRIAGFVFADNSPHCTTSLERVVAAYRGGKRQLYVLRGDANDLTHLDRITALIPSSALAIAYLDPEGLDLHWNTIRTLAWRFKRLDLLINFPVPAIDRCLETGTPTNLAHVERVLGHPDPRALYSGAGTRDAIRGWFHQQLRDLAYGDPEGHEIVSDSKRVPQYDLLLASRHPLGPRLYSRANRDAPDGQRGLDMAG